MSSSDDSGNSPTSYPSAFRAFSTRSSEAAESRPTAFPTCDALLVELVNTKANRFSKFGLCRSLASRSAIPASRSVRSGSATCRLTSPSCSLKANGTEMMRPSNSGIATFMAVSSGFRPRALVSHGPRPPPSVMPCTTGAPSRASAETFSPAAVMPPAFTSPMAKDRVEINTSACRSNANAFGSPAASTSFSDVVNTGRASAPASSSVSISVSMKAVLPLRACAR